MSRLISYVKQQNKSIGNHWFDKPTMKFFNTEILDTYLYKDRYFITRERPDDTHPWGYSVRCAHSNGKIETAASGLCTATGARKRMRQLARENGYA